MPGVFRTASVTSEDGQFVANFPEGSVPVRDGEVSVKAEIEPVAPETLGPLPPGLFADGNAYRMTLAFQPSGQPLETLAVPGNVVLTVPAPGTIMVHSVDGRSWERLEGGGHASGSLAAPFTRPGIFLGASETPLDFGTGASSDGGGVWFVVVLILALAAGLVVVPILVRRSRRNRAVARSPRAAPGGGPEATRAQEPARPAGGPEAQEEEEEEAVRRARLGRAGAVMAVLVSAGVLLSAQPAAAHVVTGVSPTNYRSRIVGVTPPLPDVEVKLLDLGRRVELTNRGDTDVIVLGYEGEPYLRVGPTGVYENDLSPTAEENREGSGVVDRVHPDDARPGLVR